MTSENRALASVLTVKDRVVDDPAIAQMLNDDALEEGGRHATIPHALWVDDDDRAAGADAEAWCLPALYAGGPEEKALSLEKRRELRVELAAAPIWRAKASDTDEHVS